MRYIVINDYDRLKRILEDPRMYKIYRRYVPADVKNAKVMEYKHDGGVEIRGWSGRWWVYVRLTYGDGFTYDLALWKLGNFLDKLREKGVIDIVEPAEERKREPVSN
jgi:hypothetical protein